MKEWFKARNLWGAAILTLSDTEAGRLMKALWSYTMTGEQPNLSGAERGIFAMIQMTLSQDEAIDAEISKKRAAAGSAGGKQKVANQANATFATNDVANQANALIRIKNIDIRDNIEKEIDKEKESEPKQMPARQRPRFTPPTVEEVRAYCQEKKYSFDPEQFVDFYASKGWKVGKDPMVDWKASARTWNRRDGGKGTASAKGSSKVVVAHEYEQRDYSGVQDELMAKQEAEMRAFLSGAGA
jgi:hypothetical protein